MRPTDWASSQEVRRAPESARLSRSPLALSRSNSVVSDRTASRSCCASSLFSEAAAGIGRCGPPGSLTFERNSAAALRICRKSSLIQCTGHTIVVPMPHFPRHPNSLVQLLREAQEAHGWLPRAAAGRSGARTRPDAGAGRGRGRLLPLLPHPAGGPLPRAVQRQHHRPHARQRGADGRPVPSGWAWSPARCARTACVSVDTHLLHRPVRPGPGAAGQPSPRDHPPGRRRASRRWPS